MAFYIVYDKETLELESLAEYEPGVPESKQVVEVSEREYRALENGTGVFDTKTLSVIDMTDEVEKKKYFQIEQSEYREFLNSTDWKVLRHIRERALGLETSLTQEEYIELETQRHEISKKIEEV